MTVGNYSGFSEEERNKQGLEVEKVRLRYAFLGKTAVTLLVGVQSEMAFIFINLIKIGLLGKVLCLHLGFLSATLGQCTIDYFP